MTHPPVELQTATDGDLDTIARILERNGLPATDLETAPATFYLAFVDDERIGIGGLEQYGGDGLLRSVVIEESVRGTGLGTALFAALETRARDQEIETLYLLTTTAADFFAKQGFHVVDRATVPSSIQATTEFSDLCPDSATCMEKSLS